LTVAAVNGGCAGAGFAWAAACDLRIASSSARFSTSFLELGLPGELGIPWTLQRALGGAVARDLCFLPRKIEAEEAMRVGFVSRVMPADSFSSDVSQLVTELASRDPRAIRDLKRNFLDAERLPLGEYVEVEAVRQLERFSGESRVATLEHFTAHHARLRNASQQAAC
jgi:2-(1,2-epoxy-1,2-dihydrophenyl)acetyl-CoA isomerase